MNKNSTLARLLAAVFASTAITASAQTLTLEQLFDIAEANSARLKPFITAEAEAKREVDVARSQRLPDISAALSLSYIGDGFTTRRDFGDYQRAPIPHFGNGFGISLSQPVYAGGAITEGIRLAELKTTASRYTTELQRDNIRFRIAGCYLDIYKCRNMRGVIEKNIVRARKVLDQMRARYEQGTALRNDITRYELLLSDLSLELVRIDNTLDILNRDLVVTVGLPEGSVISTDTTILARSLPSDEEAWWQRRAADSAPSLRLAATQVSISRRAESIVRAERLPKVGISAGWTIDGPILTEIPPINRNLSYWFVGVGVSYNLSSLYKSNRKLDASRLAVRRAAENLDVARQDLTLGVNSDYTRYREAYVELKTRLKGVELADRNYTTVSTRYNNGMALVTDMLDAANSRLDAERQLVNARINIIYYYYKLLFTSGQI